MKLRKVFLTSIVSITLVAPLTFNSLESNIVAHASKITMPAKYRHIWYGNVHGEKANFKVTKTYVIPDYHKNKKSGNTKWYYKDIYNDKGNKLYHAYPKANSEPIGIELSGNSIIVHIDLGHFPMHR